MDLILLFMFNLVSVQTESLKHKSVNLALETVLEFNNKHREGDIQFIDKVRGFLDKVKDVITRGEDGRKYFRSAPIKFTDFVKSAMRIISKYTDEDLEDVVAVINDEIRKYHNKGCKFYELIENENVRRYMAEKLENINETPGVVLREKLKNISVLFDNNYLDDRETNILDFINSLYGKEATPKFKNVLENLELYGSKSKRANLDLIKMIRDGVRTVIFDHYTNLNRNARRELKIRLEKFWNDLSKPGKVVHHIWKYIPYTKFNKHKILVAGKKSTPRTNLKNTIDTDTDQTSVITKRKKKYHFISLYPEDITKKQSHRHSKKKTTSTMDTYTNLRSINKKYKNNVRSNKSEFVKKIIKDYNTVIDVQAVKESKYKDIDDNYETKTTIKNNRKHRFVTKRRSQKSTDYKQIKRSSHRFRIDPKTTELNEGLSIEVSNRDKGKSLRKNYDNETIINDNVTLVDIATKSTSTSNYVKRIKELEKELSEVRKQMRNNRDRDEQNTINNNKQSDILKDSTETSDKNDEEPIKVTEYSKATIVSDATSIISKKNTKQHSNITRTVYSTKNEDIVEMPVLRSNLNLHSDNDDNEIIKEYNKNATEDFTTVKNKTDLVPLKDSEHISLNDSFEENKLYEEGALLDAAIGESNLNLTAPFNIEKYLNESKAYNVVDDPKKKIMHEIMKKDLGKLFERSTSIGTMNSTLAKSEFTDPFADIDQDVDDLIKNDKFT